MTADDIWHLIWQYNSKQICYCLLNGESRTFEFAFEFEFEFEFELDFELDFELKIELDMS